MNIDTNGLHLGDQAEDQITGFTGTVVAVTQWITGCARVTLQPRIGDDGKVPDSSSFDAPTVRLVNRPTSVPGHGDLQPATGGPRPEPVKR